MMMCKRHKKALLICFMLVAGILIIPLVESGYCFVRGLVAFRNGFEGGSVKQLEKSIKANPYFPEAYMLLVVAYAE